MIIPTKHILYIVFSILIILFFVNHCKAQSFEDFQYETMCFEHEPENTNFMSFSMPILTFGQGQRIFIPIDLYDDEELIPLQNPLTRQRVILLGDSQTIGPLGYTFERHFLNDYNAISFTRLGMRGWGFYRWNRHRDRIDRIISNIRPTIILILLGGNDWTRSGREDVEETIEDFWSYINSASSRSTSRRETAICWIESPAIIEAPGIRTSRETQEISDGRIAIGNSIQQTIGNDFFISTSDIVITDGRSEDGIHFTGRGAEVWYQAIIPRIETCIRNQTMQR